MRKKRSFEEYFSYVFKCVWIKYLKPCSDVFSKNCRIVRAINLAQLVFRLFIAMLPWCWPSCQLHWNGFPNEMISVGKYRWFLTKKLDEYYLRVGNIVTVWELMTFCYSEGTMKRWIVTFWSKHVHFSSRSVRLVVAIWLDGLSEISVGLNTKKMLKSTGLLGSWMETK